MGSRKILSVHICLIIFCLCLIGGCGSPYKSVNLDPLKLFEEKSKNAVNSSRPSWQTQQTLRLLFLDGMYKKDRQGLISTLEQRMKAKPSHDVRMALAELSLLEAQKLKRSNSQKATTYYFIAAQHAYDALFFDTSSVATSPLEPSFGLMGDIYNLAVSEMITLRSDRPDKWDTKDFDHDGVHYHFEVLKEGNGVWDPAWFDYLHNSYEVKVTGLENDYVTEGLGAPMVGIVKNPVQNPNFGRFYPPRLGAYPVSAVLLFDPIRQGNPPTRNIRLVFYDSFVTEFIDIRGQSVPLEADFTTPLGLQLRNVKPFSLGFRNLLKSDIEVEHAGVYMLQAYRPNKIPVVLVHGLLSSPATWATIFNDLRGDPTLRDRYQFWFFMYPTGLPVGYSSMILREQLESIKDMYDPDGTNPYFNQMVIIGHSMGGLLTRAMVQDSGSVTGYWDFYFKEPYETINLDPKTKELVKKMIIFEPLPYIQRAVFISTPHRGSPLADAWYTHMLSGMVGLPSALSDATTVAIDDHVLTKEAAKELTKSPPNSLILLSPSSVFVKATNSVPLRSDIPYHSIIGTRKPTTVGEGTSDGVVQYESSHLDMTVSEKLVPSGHGAHQHPIAIAEVKRILHEHLDSIQ